MSRKMITLQTEFSTVCKDCGDKLESGLSARCPECTIKHMEVKYVREERRLKLIIVGLAIAIIIVVVLGIIYGFPIK